MKKKRKLKVRHFNKQYPIHQSPLYRLSSLKKLSVLLAMPLKDIRKLNGNNDSRYNVFTNKDDREIQEPFNEIYVIHNKLASLLSRIDTPTYLHSFKKQYSHITNSKTHLGSEQVITFDIKAFYQNITQDKIRMFFKNDLKCSPDIAFLLSKICSYDNHLPTGSQVSIYLNFLVNRTMFDEMHSLAETLKICITVYADDVTISGEKVDMGMLNTMSKIVERHGHTINKQKTRKYSNSQVPVITGIALCNGKTQPTNEKFKELRQKSNFLLRVSNDLDLDFLKKESMSLDGTLNYFSQLSSEVPKSTLEARDRLAKLLGI